MKRQKDRAIRKDLVNMKQESMERILQDCPNHISNEKACKALEERRQRDERKTLNMRIRETGRWDLDIGELLKRAEEESNRDWNPYHWYYVPLGFGKHLYKRRLQTLERFDWLRGLTSR